MKYWWCHDVLSVKVHEYHLVLTPNFTFALTLDLVAIFKFQGAGNPYSQDPSSPQLGRPVSYGDMIGT